MKEEFDWDAASGRLVWRRNSALNRDELKRLATIVQAGWEGNQPSRVEVAYTSLPDAEKQASAVEFAGAIVTHEGTTVRGGVPITVRADFGLK